MSMIEITSEIDEFAFKGRFAQEDPDVELFDLYITPIRGEEYARYTSQLLLRSAASTLVRIAHHGSSDNIEKSQFRWPDDFSHYIASEFVSDHLPSLVVAMDIGQRVDCARALIAMVHELHSQKLSHGNIRRATVLKHGELGWTLPPATPIAYVEGFGAGRLQAAMQNDIKDLGDVFRLLVETPLKESVEERLLNYSRLIVESMCLEVSVARPTAAELFQWLIENSTHSFRRFVRKSRFLGEDPKFPNLRVSYYNNSILIGDPLMNLINGEGENSSERSDLERRIFENMDAGRSIPVMRSFAKLGTELGEDRSVLWWANTKVSPNCLRLNESVQSIGQVLAEKAIEQMHKWLRSHDLEQCDYFLNRVEITSFDLFLRGHCMLSKTDPVFPPYRGWGILYVASDSCRSHFDWTPAEAVSWLKMQNQVDLMSKIIVCAEDSEAETIAIDVPLANFLSRRSDSWEEWETMEPPTLDDRFELPIADLDDDEAHEVALQIAARSAVLSSLGFSEWFRFPQDRALD
jgi:hypothetical protein